MDESASTTTAGFSAGRKGEDVRSDLFACFDEHGTGLELSIRSRVEPYYGPAIRQQAHDVLAALGIEQGRLELDDAGALPFVLEARIECAIRQAQPGRFPSVNLSKLAESVIPRLAEGSGPSPQESPRNRLRRSRLYVPGCEPKYMLNAGLHHPDGIIFDLEDSVHPSEKDASRLLVRNALLALDVCGAERMVRINQLPLGLSDLEEIVPARPDLVLIPKVERPEQVQQVDEAITQILDGLGETRALWLMPILESALGIENAFTIAGASPRVAALTLGLEDYTADLGVVKTPSGEESLYARNRVVNAAKAAGVQAIDSVYGDIEDLAGLETWAHRSRAMGFEGMGCVHPPSDPCHSPWVRTNRSGDRKEPAHRPSVRRCRNSRARRSESRLEDDRCPGGPTGRALGRAGKSDGPAWRGTVVTTAEAPDKVGGQMVRNQAGRLVPSEVNGKQQTPYQGVHAHRAKGRKAAPAHTALR